MKYFLLALFSFCFAFVEAQEEIKIEDLGFNLYKFTSVDSPLTQIAGAPEPFYTYWWEFGDGHFSTQMSPKHHYKSSQNFNLLLSRTNNYDDGPTRPNKKKIVSARNEQIEASLLDKPSYINQTEAVSIQKNRNPKPNDEVIFVETYQNTSLETQKGILLFFYNEKSFSKDHFILADYRNHYMENEIVTTNNIMQEKLEGLKTNDDMTYHFLEQNFYENLYASSSKNINTSLLFSVKDKENETKNYNKLNTIQKDVEHAYQEYRDVIAFEFDDLKPNEQRNMFLSLLTTETMLKDTNVTISVKSIFIPENYKMTQSTKHLMPIVTAHDPNKLIVNKNKTGRGFAKKKALEYEIKFQNVGKGPAEEVKLRFYNNADIDIKSIEILDFEPKCELCSENCKGSYLDTLVTDEYVEFFFHNIYLPGTRQSDIENRDASKGFVKFALKTEKRIKQNNLTCRTEIYFDKEDPIRTNNSKTRFQKRIYVGVEVGANYLPTSFPRFEWFARGTFTLRMGKNWFYRAELSPKYQPQHISSTSSSIDTVFSTRKYGYSVTDPNGIQQTIDPKDSLTLNYYSQITNTETEVKKQSVSLEIVPLQIRREITEYFSIGMGVRTQFRLFSFEKIKDITTVEKFDITAEEKFEFDGPPAGGNYQVLNYRLENVMLNQINSETIDNSTETKQAKYQLDAISGIFIDVNIGRLYSIPYFGARANFDYQFSTQKFNPNIQFYLGANF